MNKRIPIFIGFIILALAIWIQLTEVPSVRSMFIRLDNLSYDLELRTKLLGHKKITDGPVVIIDIDDKSLEVEGRWPWPRAKLADLVNRIREGGAVVIAFDMLFPEKQRNIADTVLDELKKQSLLTNDIDTSLKKIQPHFADDSIFATSLTQQIDVVLGMTFIPEQETVGTLPPPILTLQTPLEEDLGFIIVPGYIADIPILQDAAKKSGFLNVFPDADGIVRRVPLLIRYQNGLYPSLALQAVSSYLLSTVKLVTASYGNTIRLEGIQIGDRLVPTDTKAQVIIPFPGRSYTLPFISATDVLHNKVQPHALEGKIVFVGTSAIGLGDLHATAIQPVYPGVEIQADIAYGMLQNTFSYKPAWSLGAELVITTILGLIFIFTFPYLGPRVMGLLIITIPVGLVLTNNWVWSKTGFIFSIIVPMLLPVALAIVNILYGYLFETLRRERLKEMFGQYVPEEHIDEMLSAGGNYGLYGDDRELTVLFADIRGFTTISEPLSATQLKDLLNEFFTPMTEIIFKHRGTIDKYVGDMIMAFWGAPMKDKKHAQHALSAAVEMQTAVNKLHQIFAEKNWPEINIGIGLNTGVMSVGDMGSKFRRNYTVLGDAVNLASRVESLSKYYGVKIIVTENTQHNQKIFLFRQLDRVRVKGKKTGVTIFELLCRRSDASKELLKEIEQSEQAMNAYFNQEWETAQTLFQELHTSHPEVKLYKLYLERIAEFKNNPPPTEWDGVYVHTSK